MSGFLRGGDRFLAIEWPIGACLGARTGVGTGIGAEGASSKSPNSSSSSSSICDGTGGGGCCFWWDTGANGSHESRSLLMACEL